MILRRYSPTALLQPFIKAYLVLDANANSTNRVIPDTSMTLAFRYKGAVMHAIGQRNDLLPFASISGLRKSFRLITYAPGSGTILVKFKEEGASMFFREPLYEFMNESVALECLSGYADIASIEARLSGLVTEEEKIDLIERYLLSKISHGNRCDVLIHSALQKIHSTNGTISIGELIDFLCISKDPFEKRFRRIVGMPAKQFSSIIKLRGIIDKGLANHTFAQAAWDAGYYDQAHFNKAFSAFTGQTPTEFFSDPAGW